MNDEQSASDKELRNYERHDLKRRTKAWVLEIIRLYSALPRTAEAQILGKQVLRSGTSVGAHYREATRARSSAEFISKIECGSQELEETRYWLELMAESGIIRPEKLESLLREAVGSTSIFVASAKTAKKKNR